MLILGEAIHNALVECSLKEGQFSDNLEGACAIASAFFIKEAKRLFGMRISFRATVSHAWASYKNHVYDITATQFGRKEKVFATTYKVISDMNDCYLKECYMQPRIVTLDRVNSRWPSYQRPINYRLNWVSAHTARVVHLKSKLA